jgi:protease-4
VDHDEKVTLPMRFLRALWRFLKAVKDVLALLALLLFFGLIFAVLSSGGKTSIPSGGGALVLQLKGSLSEQPADARPLDLVSGAGGPQLDQFRLRDVVRALGTAATDNRVKAVVLDLDGFTGGGQAAVSAVGHALDSVRARKPVLAFATGYDDPSYLLAAHASEVWLDPIGAVLTAGPGGSQLYYKGLLDKLGVTAHVYRVGKFKSAVEPYTRTDASPEAKAAEQALVGALWGRWQAEVAAARPKAHFADYLASLSSGHIPNTTLAANAQAMGLVDKLGDRIAFGQRVAQIAGTPDKAPAPGDYKTISLADWEQANPAPTSGDAIGVLTVAGDIVDGKAGAGTAGGDSIAEALGKAVAKGNLKALVVRVDSPGGSVTASDRIRSAILAAKAKGLPVVISMGSVAASGGYWVSTAGDTIIADPSTITGSIGVFGIIPTFEGSLGKIGLSADGVQATPLSGEPDVLRGTTPVIDALIQAGIDQVYAHFTGLVAAARHLPIARVDEIAQGRVWDGVTAQKIGLVDRFGTLEDAIAEAAKRAKLDPAKVHPVYIEREKSAVVRLLQMLAGNSDSSADASAADPFASLGRRPDMILARAVGDARRIMTGPAVQVRCLACDAEQPPAPADVVAARRMMAQAGL